MDPPFPREQAIMLSHFLLSPEIYEQSRPAQQARIIALKKRRRVVVGPHMSLLFENRRTLLFQIQEVLRSEGITSEQRIASEVETYDGLLPRPGVLLATLFFEFTSRAEAHAVLANVADFDEHTFLRVGPHRLPVRYVRSPGEPRLTAVNYLHIPVPDAQRQLLTQNSVPVAFEITHPAYMQAAILPAITRREIAADLGLLYAQAISAAARPTHG
jgi:hypothetical protein